MHPYKRSTRLSILLREEIADIVMRKVKDPRLGFITVTDVALSEDLKVAKVFISVMGEGDKEITLKILNSARGLIRNEVSKRVRIKFIPSIEFRIDRSVERGNRIDQLLKELEEHHETSGSSTEHTEE
ncbi:MAG: 30S ribosome-binding factor RbfA [Dissulfurispiraceae bacterium]